MAIRTRFAPSPTGRLHLGHALAARVARDLAHSQPGGSFLLRFEDIDTTRVRPEYYDAILADLRWLGIVPDEPPLRQTSRASAYAAALARLQDLGVVYPCFCTRRAIQEEVSRMATAPHGADGPPYPGTCRHLTADERQRRITAGEGHAWRLDAARASALTGPLTFYDLRFGTIAVDLRPAGDVVLARKDIGTAYHLAVVVDDAFQHITHVTRGEDLLEATHIHRTLQALLGLPVPIWFHHRLVLDEADRRLAKRCDSLALATLREVGHPPTEVLALAGPPEIPGLES